MPVAIARLRELIDLAGSAGVNSVDVTEGGVRIRIARTGAAPSAKAVAPAAAAAPAGLPAVAPDILAAPMFGVLHLTPAPGAKPFAAVGDRVTKGQQLCLIEAMKMFNEFYCDRDGRLAAILAEAGGEIARGQPLFRIVEA